MTAEPPAEPIEELGDCQHCDGAGIVSDEYSPDGYTLVGFEAPCAHCDGSGCGPVDADGLCACEDCLHLPRVQRLGWSDQGTPLKPDSVEADGRA